MQQQGPIHHWCCERFSVAVFLLLLPQLHAAPPPVAWPDDGCEKIGLSAGGSIFNGNLSPHDPDLLTVATDMGGAFITYDNGGYWHTISCLQLSGSHVAPAAFHPTNPDVIYWDNCGSELKVSRDRGRTWAHVGGEQPWGRDTLVRIWLDPDVPERIFVGTEKGVYLSRNAGASWDAIAVTGALHRVVAERTSPATARVYWIGTRAGLFRSDDDGRTFVRKMSGVTGDTLNGFAGGSNSKGTVLYVTTPCTLVEGKLTGGIFRSRDRGETWESCMHPALNVSTKRQSDFARDPLPQYQRIVCPDLRPERAFVFCDGNGFFPPYHTTIYRTDDGGAGWQSVFSSDPRFAKGDPRMAAAPDLVCNVATDWETDAWGQREQGEVRGLEIDPANPDRVLVNQTRFIHVSTNAGLTWASPYAGTWRVDAQGRKHWSNSGEVVTSSWHYSMDPFDTLNRFICYTDIGLARSVDGGKFWTPEMYRLGKVIGMKYANSCYALAFDPVVTGRVWGAFSAKHDIPNEAALFNKNSKLRNGCLAVSDDHGASWRKINMPFDAPVMDIVIDPHSPPDRRTLYASLFGTGVICSTDGGASWVARTNGLDPEGNRLCLNLILHQDGTLFVATASRQKRSTVGVGIWRSTDQGASWTNLVPAKSKWVWIRDFAVDPDDSKSVLVPTSLGPDPGLHRTVDGGITWTTLFSRKDRYHYFGVYFHPLHKDWLYLTGGEGSGETDPGIYLSKDRGKTWVPFEKIPFRPIQRVDFDPADPAHIYLSTFGSSVLKSSAEP